MLIAYEAMTNMLQVTEAPMEVTEDQKVLTCNSTFECNVCNKTFAVMIKQLLLIQFTNYFAAQEQSSPA